ncbi:MAG: hypothetical protein JWP87_1183 [Labilithrix sp.]|nr:hypothetical protein [Labilithrix sp.]
MIPRVLQTSGHLLALALPLAACAGFVACSSSSGDSGPPDPAGGIMPSDGDGDGGGANAETGTGTGTETDGSTVEAPSIPPPTACPTAKYNTLVIVGDSISDVGAGGGGAAQEPFYRKLLVQNDDAKYPDWKGFDLATCWGLDPTTGVVKVSKAGAVATLSSTNNPTDKGVLLNQVTGLPATLPGPVLVVGTIGGNDVTAGLVTAANGTPQQVQARIDAFTAGFGAAMTELTKPDRFGAGVKADVLMPNVYDPSGGTGHFYYEPKAASCPGALTIWPDKKETATALAQWNGAMSAEAAKHPGVTLLELNAPFASHAVSTPANTNWFYEDCIHPSSLGHNAVRGVFWAAMRALH